MCMWVDSSSAASVAERPQYGELRRVLMHAWLSSVHWDATREAREVFASVPWSQSEVRGDGETIKLILHISLSRKSFVLWILTVSFFLNHLAYCVRSTIPE